MTRRIRKRKCKKVIHYFFQKNSQPVFVMRETISILTHYQVYHPCHVSRISRSLHDQKYTSCLSLSHIIPKAHSSTSRLVQSLSYLTILRNNRCISVTLFFFKHFTRTKTKWNYLSYRVNICCILETFHLNAHQLRNLRYELKGRPSQLPMVAATTCRCSQFQSPLTSQASISITLLHTRGQTRAIQPG
jgi:hypothetical protein